jgi:hypothetical protein
MDLGGESKVLSYTPTKSERERPKNHTKKNAKKGL